MLNLLCSIGFWKSGPPCLGRSPRDPIPGQAADDGWMDGFWSQRMVYHKWKDLCPALKYFFTGISQRKDVPSKMAIFDGKELTFEESDWFIVNFLRLLWRYGFNFLRMHMWVESVLDKFMRWEVVLYCLYFRMAHFSVSMFKRRNLSASAIYLLLYSQCTFPQKLIDMGSNTIIF